jgi:nucleotide-binding universal stress UspA family protein
MFRNILVSIDGSPHADRALTEAIDIARAANGRLTIFTAVQQLPSVAFWGPAAATETTAVTEELEREALENLRAAEERVPEEVPVTTKLSLEPVRMALLEAIRDGGHDLLAMGSRGRGAISAAVLGSVSHYVLNHSPIPVLIVPGDQEADDDSSAAPGG